MLFCNEIMAEASRQITLRHITPFECSLHVPAGVSVLLAGVRVL